MGEISRIVDSCERRHNSYRQPGCIKKIGELRLFFSPNTEKCLAWVFLQRVPTVFQGKPRGRRWYPPLKNSSSFIRTINEAHSKFGIHRSCKSHFVELGAHWNGST